MIKTIFFNLLFTRNILKYVSNRRLFSIPIILKEKNPKTKKLEQINITYTRNLKWKTFSTFNSYRSILTKRQRKTFSLIKIKEFKWF